MSEQSIPVDCFDREAEALASFEAQRIAIEFRKFTFTAKTAEAIREDRLGGLSRAHGRWRDDYFSTNESGGGGGALTSPAPSLSSAPFIVNVEPGRT